MGSLEEYDRLKTEGRHVEATSHLLDSLENREPDHPDSKLVALHLFRSGCIELRLLNAIEKCISTLVIETGEDLELVLAHAQLAWIKDQRDPDASRARDSARKVIERAPDLPDGYRILGLSHLSRHEYRDAYVTFSAVHGLGNQVNYENFRNLSKFLMRGVSPISFELAGIRYKFDLTTHNAEAIESSAFHSVGLLTELEELDHLRSLTNGKSINHVVEVGVLLGNHTAFFLKCLSPSKLTLIDADPDNIPFIENTISYNVGNDPRPDVKVHNLFASNQSTKTRVGGKDVVTAGLDEIIRSPVDLIKVDVDGGEVNLLKGAENMIQDSRPLVMIETAPSTHDRVVAWFDGHSYTMDRVFDRGGYENVFFRP